MRRAIEHTARAPTSAQRLQPFDQGRGLLQVAAAFEMLVAEAAALAGAQRRGGGDDDDALGWHPALRVQISVGADGARGIYLREAHETDAPKELNVTVTPVFDLLPSAVCHRSSGSGSGNGTQDIVFKGDDAATFESAADASGNNVRRVAFEANVALVASAPWVRCARVIR